MTAHPRLQLARPWLVLGAGLLLWLGVYRSLQPLWDRVVFGWWGMDSASRWGQALHFFLYDATKILWLLVAVVFAVSILRSFFSLEHTRALLGGKRQGLGNAMAALLGVVTPFCSCSAVPAFMGFVAAGVPLGVTFSFLIASPMVNEVALVLLYSLFGWPIALLYLMSGLLLAIGAGWLLGRMGLERWIEPVVFQTKLGTHSLNSSAGLLWEQRFELALQEVQRIVGRVWPYVLVGIALGALIHGWVPAQMLSQIAGANNPFAVPLAVLLGVPLYSNAAGVLPLIEALYQKGVPMGTLLAFMMAVVALSLPEMVLLRQVLKPRLIALWVAVVALGIMLTGYVFNALLA